MLRTIRLILAVVCFILITLLFLDFTGTLHTWFGWLANIQFLPALLALNVSVIISLIVVTLLFGRIYCSVVCPLGVFQDVIGKRVQRVYTDLISESAHALLVDVGVEVSYKQIVHHIENRDKTNWCPLEKSCKKEN